MASTWQSQNALVLKYLESRRSLTAAEAMDRFGCFRLAARICELRARGHNIVTIWETNSRTRKRWAR
jgi:hypothetical protein